MHAPSTPVARDDASSNGGGGGSTPLSSRTPAVALSVTQGFARAGSMMMQKINDKAAPNLELQVLLLETIESYEAEKRRALSRDLTLQEAIVAEKEERKRKREVCPVSELVELVIDPKVNLRRGQIVFGGWVKKLFVEVSQCLLFGHNSGGI